MLISYCVSLVMATITKHIFINSDFAKTTFTLTWTEILLLFMRRYCHSWVRTKDFLLRLCESNIRKVTIIFRTEHFSAVKFAMIFEKNMSFFVISKFSKVWKKSRKYRMGFFKKIVAIAMYPGICTDYTYVTGTVRFLNC